VEIFYFFVTAVISASLGFVVSAILVSHKIDELYRENADLRDAVARQNIPTSPEHMNSEFRRSQEA
jgi:hypothetical protein